VLGGGCRALAMLVAAVGALIGCGSAIAATAVKAG